MSYSLVVERWKLSQLAESYSMSKRRYTPEEITDILDRATSENIEWSYDDDEEGTLDGNAGPFKDEEQLVSDSEDEMDDTLSSDEAHVMQMIQITRNEA